MARVPKCIACGKPVRGATDFSKQVKCLSCLERELDELQKKLDFMKEPEPKQTFGSRLQKSKEKEAPHLIIEARAGTGKTTTLVEGLKFMKGLPIKITPSPQQARVWEEMGRSGAFQSTCFVAFNKSIATELQVRVPEGCVAMTMHSMGFKAVRQAFGLTGRDISQYRVQDIIARLLGQDIRDLRKEKFDVLKATENLVGLCKINLTDLSNRNTRYNTLTDLAYYYDIELNGNAEEVFDLVPRVLEECKNVSRDRRVDFNDMIWLPVALNLPVYQYDVLLVDEAQDLNRCQHALVMKAGCRLIFCGDPKQAIYGFAGADCESMERLEEMLKATDRGCVHLPLTVTRRCGKAIVAEAQQFVPDFEAYETNPEGKISRRAMKGGPFPTTGYDSEPVEGYQGTPVSETGYFYSVKDGDMCLCRVNAPLVSQCFKFLKAGRKANIQGRDIGQGLVSLIKKMKANSIVDLTTKLSDWYQKEVEKETSKRNPNEFRLIALQDRYECLEYFMEDQVSVEQVVAKIESVFTDDKESPGVMFSSIHKAKGLEAKRVFFLEPTGATCPHPMAKTSWAKAQEFNLRYVAITRAIEELVYVS